MKRERESVEIQGFDAVKCLMLLSQSLQQQNNPKHHNSTTGGGGGDAFECKTCHRRFSSFQALGGHCASHKKPKLVGSDQKGPNEQQSQLLSLSSSTTSKKPKTHECTFCGQEFPTGQALGGHMRKHRAAINEGFSSDIPPFPAVLKRSNSSRRVMCLDLNLTPLENDLRVLFGNKAPRIDLCI